jgi:hypothetical protein
MATPTVNNNMYAQSPTGKSTALGTDVLGNLKVTVLNSSVPVPVSAAQSGDWSITTAGESNIGGTAPDNAVQIGFAAGPNLQAVSNYYPLPVEIIQASPDEPCVIGGLTDIKVPLAVRIDADGFVMLSDQGVTQIISQSGSPIIPVSIVSPTSNTSSSPAQQTVGSSASQILVANGGRLEVRVVNTGTTAVYLAFGKTPSSTAYAVALSACSVANDGTGGVWVSDLWKGNVNAISGTSGTVCVTELTT